MENDCETILYRFIIKERTERHSYRTIEIPSLIFEYDIKITKKTLKIEALDDQNKWQLEELRNKIIEER